MDTNRSSPRFHPRRALAAGCAALLLATAMPAFAAGVDVKAAGKFELDSNALDTAAAGDDWSTLVAGNGGSIATSHILADFNSPDYNFIGGSSKDTQAISAWQFNASGMTPDKDNLTNAYAAAYTASNGHLLFYFGADRYAVNGDAQMGFWFFKNAVSIDPATGHFTGVHHDNDTLVQVNFLNGGKTAQIGVFTWSGGALLKLVENTITSKNSLVTEVCTPGNFACARTNVSGTTAAYWPFTPKTGTTGTFPAQAFFEGGIDVTQLVGGDLCFSTFMAESRASQAFDSTLKDFAIGPLQTCGISVGKTCDSTRATTDAEYAAVGPSYHKLFASTYTITVTNSGGGGLPADTVISYVDDVGTPAVTSDDQTGSHTGALAGGDSYAFSPRLFYTNINGAVNSVSAMAEFGTETLVADPDATAVCPNVNSTGSLSVTKDCSTPGVELVPSNGKLVAKVHVHGAICNNGVDGFALTLDSGSVVNILGTNPNDPAASSHTVALITKGAAHTPVVLPDDLAQDECWDYSDSYFPAAGDGSTSPAGDAAFSDAVRATGHNVHLDVNPTAVSNLARCPVCLPQD